MLELFSLIGSAGSGKILGLISDFLSNRSQAQAEEKEREHQRDLAFKGQLGDYLQASHDQVDGKTTLLSFTLCAMYLMFSATVCAAALYCFWVGFGEVSIKDPDAEGSSWSILGGAIRRSLEAKSITDISPMGVGYLILHPILFILSMVSTGTRASRRGK